MIVTGPEFLSRFCGVYTGRWFSPGPTVSSTNKTDRNDITEILLKVALNTSKQTIKHIILTLSLYIIARITTVISNIIIMAIIAVYWKKMSTDEN